MPRPVTPNHDMPTPTERREMEMEVDHCRPERPNFPRCCTKCRTKHPRSVACRRYVNLIDKVENKPTTWKPRSAPTCEKCQGRHPTWTCRTFDPKRPNNNNAFSTNPSNKNANNSRLCYRCHLPGHFARECTNRPTQSQEN